MSATVTETAAQLKTHILASDSEPEFKLHSFDRATVNLDEAIATLKYNGGIKINGFLNQEEVQRHEAIADAYLTKLDFPDPKDTTKRLTRLPSVMPELVEKILTDEMYLGLCDAILTTKHSAWFDGELIEFVNKPIVTTSTAFEVAPGTGVQTLHRDCILWANKFDKIKPEDYNVGRDVCISFFIAGRDTTAKNGATRWVPGSHLGHYLDKPESDKAIHAELKAGDAFVMLSSSHHGAGANRSEDERRLVYSLFMMQAHLRQEENLYLGLPIEQVKKFPVSVQRRLGYDWSSSLGWVDYRSPLESILGHAPEPHSFNVNYGKDNE